MRPRRQAAALAVLLGVLTALGRSEPARADETADLCLADSIEGQVLRANGHLLRASEHLAACARPECEVTMRQRCAAWLEKAKLETPHLVVRVEDDRHAPVPDALVHVDDVLVPLVVPASPLPVDRGQHLLRADYAGRRATRTVTTTSGELVATLTIDLQATVSERPTPRLAYGLAGTSAVSALAFGAFATSALVQSHHLDACAPYCEPSRRGPLDAALIGSDVALGVSVSAAIGALVVYLARPVALRQVRITASAPGAAAVWSF